MEWSETIVTDARDVYDNASTEKGGLPQQKALTLEIATIREWLVNSGALIRWTADENIIMNGLTKDHKESRQHLTQVLQNGERSVQRETLRRSARNRRLNPNVQAGRNLSRLQRVRVRKSNTTSLILWRMHGKFFFFGTVSSLVTQNVAYFCHSFFFSLNSEAWIVFLFFLWQLYLETEKLDVDLSHRSRLLSRWTGSARKYAETIELDTIRRSSGADKDTREGMVTGVKYQLKSLERAMGMEDAT